MKKMRRVLTTGLVVVLICLLIPKFNGLKFNYNDAKGSAKELVAGVDYVAGEVFAEADSMKQAQEIARKYNIVLKSYNYGIAVYEVKDAMELIKKSEEMEKDGISPLNLNLLYRTCLDDTDDQPDKDRDKIAHKFPEYPEKRSRNFDRMTKEAGNSEEGSQWHHDEIDTKLAWSEGTKGAGVLVAVIDTGIDVNHSEFTGRISSLSYNAETEEIGLGGLTDAYGHGTHVAGIIAAAYDGLGDEVYGVAPDAELLVIKADMMDDPGWFDEVTLIRSINYAVANGADIINMSLGRFYESGVSYPERDAIRKAVAAGVVVFGAAGNDDYYHAGYPAAYEEVIAISATRAGFQFDDMHSWSNYGPEIAISAPGGEILSTNAVGSLLSEFLENYDDYLVLSGTSMATPNAVGVAALIISANPGLTPAQVKELMCGTARDLGELGRDDYFGFGIANAYAALLGPANLYDVSFDYNDSKRSPVVLKVIPGYKLFEPYSPDREGYAFTDWFISNSVTVFDFDTEINANTDLTAEWVAAQAGMYVSEFPDKNFRRAIFALLDESFDVKRKDSDMVANDATDLAGIDYLDVACKRISSMKGLEYFTGLEHLYCYGNRLTELDLSANTQLLTVECIANELTSINVSQNILLEELVCYFNYLPEIDVSNNINLQTLDIFANELTELDVSNNPNLAGKMNYYYDHNTGQYEFDYLTIGLDCGYNYLTSLDLSNNPNLEVLFCNDNFLEELDLTNNTKLTLVSLPGNRLTKLDISNCPDLLALFFAYNRVSSIDVSNNLDLEELGFAGNRIGELDLTNNSKLTYLECFDNHLTELDFSNNPELAYVFCDENYLTELDVTVNTELEYLYCTYNYIPSIYDVIGWQTISGLEEYVSFRFYPQREGEMPTGKDITASFIDPAFLAAIRDITGIKEGPILDYDVASITYLDVSDWSTRDVITDLSGIENFISLEYLDVVSQQLTDLDLSANLKLEGVNCYENQLTSIDLSNCPKLDSLDCSRNQLSTLDLSGCPKLRNLFCDDNSLTSLDVSNNPEITHLYCSNNQLSALDVSNNLELVGLNCGFNNLSVLDVTDNAQLAFLYCYENQLTTLDVSNNTELMYLGCEWNNIESIYDVIGWDELGLVIDDTFWYFPQYVTQRQAIIIFRQPTSALTVVKGETAILSVDAEYAAEDISGSELKYQWYVNTAASNSGGTVLTGEEDAEFTIPSGTNGLYYYYCVVSSDIAGVNAQTSKVATVEVIESLVSGMFAAEFPDPNFCNEILKLLNEDGGNRTGSSIMTKNDIELLENTVDLYIPNKGIKDLTGLKYFPYLSFINCSKNKLESVDFSDTPYLTALDCSNNKLSTLDLTVHTDLMYLFCEDNELTGLDLTNNTNIAYVRCMLNNMTSPAKVAGWQEHGLVLGDTFDFYPQKVVTSPELSGISVTAMPTKTSYTVGETLNLSGLEITASYSDGSSAVVTGFTTSPTNGSVLNSTGNQTVTVQYSEDSITEQTSFTVTVGAAEVVLESITVSQQPTKTNYEAGDSLDLSGLEITASYSDGSSAVVTGFTTNPTNGSVLSSTGSQTVTVQYSENAITKQTSFTVAVGTVEVFLDSISVSQLPTKTSYTVGESLNLSGLEITADYSDGSSAVVTGFTTSPTNGSVLSSPGTKTVTVQYSENAVTKQTSFTVTVTTTEVVLESISVSRLPVKLIYEIGDALDLGGLEVTASYSDGSSAVVTGFTTSPANGSLLSSTGSQTVTVQYSEGSITKQTSFTITTGFDSFTQNALEFTAVSKAEFYQIQRSTKKNTGFKTIATTTNLSFIDSGLKASTTYYYRVRSVSIVGGKTTYGKWQTVQKLTTAKLPVVDDASVTVSATGKGLNMDWTNPQGMSAIQVFYATSNTKKTKWQVATIGKTGSFYLGRLAVGKKYFYKFRYVYINGSVSYGPFSAVKNTVILDGTEPTISDGYTKVNIKFNVVGAPDAYQIQRSTQKNKGYKTIGVVSVIPDSLNSYDDYYLKAGATYYYRVRSVTKVGNKTVFGKYSAPITGQPSKLPMPVLGGNVTVTAAVQGFDFNWVNTDNVTAIQIAYATSNTKTTKWTVVTVSPDLTGGEFNLRKLAGNKKYFIKVRYVYYNGTVSYGSYCSAVPYVTN